MTCNRTTFAFERLARRPVKKAARRASGQSDATTRNFIRSSVDWSFDAFFSFMDPQCPETPVCVYLTAKAFLAYPAYTGENGALAMRGYFGIGAEGISKAMNLGAILRTAHAFGASFAFTINAHHSARQTNLSDTAKSAGHLPFYEWERIGDLRLPRGCALIGVEIDEDAIALPSLRHPLNAAYLFGPEKGNLSEQAKSICAGVVRIPAKFCVNVSIAAAIIMYDRTISMGRHTTRKGLPELGGWRRIERENR